MGLDSARRRWALYPSLAVLLPWVFLRSSLFSNHRSFQKPAIVQWFFEVFWLGRFSRSEDVAYMRLLARLAWVLTWGEVDLMPVARGPSDR